LGVWLRRRGEGVHCGLDWKDPLSIDESAPFSTQMTFHSSSYFVPNNSEFDVSTHGRLRNLLRRSYGRLAKGKEGLDMKKGMDTPLYFYQVQNYQPQKNHKVELRSHLQKLLNGLRCLNLLELEWIIFDQIKGWVTSK
jgi:hypothetical protein